MIGLCLLSALVFNSCQKEKYNSTRPVEQEEFAKVSAESEAEAETIFDNVFDNIMGVNSQVAIGGTGVFNSRYRSEGVEMVGSAPGIDSTNCYIVTITHLAPSSVFPIRIEVDFGTGCIGKDGRTRKGRITTEYSNRLTIPGAVAITKFDKYVVNDIKVEGSHIVTNKSDLINTMFVGLRSTPDCRN
jgi:hypothetical protein